VLVNVRSGKAPLTTGMASSPCGYLTGKWVLTQYRGREIDAAKGLVAMPGKSAHVKNEKQDETLKDKGMSQERAARIANSPDASSRGGKKSGSRGDSAQGGTTAQKKRAGREGGKAAHR
jgi:hypothetical protein